MISRSVDFPVVRAVFQLENIGETTLSRPAARANGLRAPRFPFEVLHRICDIDLPAINSRFHKQGVQKFAGRFDERFTFHVFLLPGLLADQHDFGARRAFPVNRLTRMSPEAAILAIPCFFRKTL